MTRPKNYAAQQGFSLIELMIVVAVVAILAAIAYPSYLDQVQRTRRSDAKIALTQMANVQEKFFSANNRYTATISGGTAMVSSLGYTNNLSPEGYYTLSAVTGGTTFTLTATARAGQAQAGDSQCQTFTITHTGAKASSPNTTACW